jgi:hypothetical protein
MVRTRGGVRGVSSQSDLNQRLHGVHRLAKKDHGAAIGEACYEALYAYHGDDGDYATKSIIVGLVLA